MAATYRLAFRELGLAIGLHAVAALRSLVTESGARLESLGTSLQALMPHVPLADTIESFWLAPSNQATESWTAHRDINAVMLATSLVPDGYLSRR
jgi:hypothetical protein